MDSAKLTEAATLLVELLSCGSSSQQDGVEMAIWTPDHEKEAAVLRKLQERCREDPGMLDAVYSLVNGAMVFTQRFHSLMGRDFVSDILGADQRRAGC